MKYLSRTALMSFLPMHTKRVLYLAERVTYTMSNSCLLGGGEQNPDITAAMHDIRYNAYADRPILVTPLPKTRHRTKQPNDATFTIYPLAGTDLTQIHGIGPFLTLRLTAECGTDLTRWKIAKFRRAVITLGLVGDPPPIRSGRPTSPPH